jgi:hypothetical protein
MKTNLEQQEGKELDGPTCRRILNGWKEISNHLERGVRTAQRWEALLGMPVHRPALKSRSAVVAFSDQLEGWLSRSSSDAQDEDVAINNKKESNCRVMRVKNLPFKLAPCRSDSGDSLEIHRNRALADERRDMPNELCGLKRMLEEISK